MSNPGGNVVVAPYVEATAAAVTAGFSKVFATCVCAAGWSGDKCTVRLDREPGSTRVNATARAAIDPGTTAVSTQVVSFRPCGPAQTFISTTWLVEYQRRCDAERARNDGGAAFGECFRSAREVAMRPFLYRYNSRLYSPQASTVRHVIRSDVEECELAGATLPTVSQFAALPVSDLDVFSRYWAQGVEQNPYSATVTEAEAQWIVSGPLGQWFAPVLDIASKAFCFRLVDDTVTPSVVRTYFLPFGGVLVRARGTLVSGLAYPSYVTGALSVDTCPQCDPCDHYAAPLCVMASCEFGKSRVLPGTFMFQ
jgi:hypothetical protein